jgi:hypothetical protein
MPELPREWITEQLKAARAKASVSKIVIHLLKAYEELPADLNLDDAKKALELLPKLAMGHVLVAPSTGPEVWLPGRPGVFRVGDQVRVVADAFDGDAGLIHNGRIGRVAAIRSGDIIVDGTDEKMPPLRGVHYSPFKLEKRVQ